MLDSLWENATRIAAFVGLVTGLTGTGLATWVRVEQVRDRRKERARKRPWCLLEISPANLAGWRRASLVFHNPSGVPFLIDTIEVVRPKGAFIASQPARSISGAFEPGRSASKMSVGAVVDRPKSGAVDDFSHRLNLLAKLPGASMPMVLQIRCNARSRSSTEERMKLDAIAKITE